MFATGETYCPVYLLKNLIQVLNPGEDALFQRPKRKFCLNDEIWFDRALLGVNSLRNMMKEISFAANLRQTYTIIVLELHLWHYLIEWEYLCTELCKYRAIEMRGVWKFIQVKGKRYNRNSTLKFWRPQLHPRWRWLQNPQHKSRTEIVLPAKTTCSPTPIRPNLSTLGTPGLKSIISLSLITQQRKVIIDLWHWLVYAHWEFCFNCAFCFF